MSKVTAQGSMFEGLFVVSLRVPPESAFAHELRAVGFDVSDVQSKYDKDIWTASLDVAHRYHYPELERFEAWRRLGRDFIRGYLQTVVGRLIGAVLPLIGITRFIERVPAFVRTGLGGTACEVELLGSTSALLSFDGPHVGSSAVMAGVLDECFERMRVKATLTAHQLGGTASSLDVRWEA